VPVNNPCATNPTGTQHSQRHLSGAILVAYKEVKPMKVPNWQHNSNKNKKTKGTCKGQLRARKQALQALKSKLNFK